MLEKEEGWESSAILSGSWDSTVALWDLRQGANAALSKWKTRGKVYAMDAVGFPKEVASLRFDQIMNEMLVCSFFGWSAVTLLRCWDGMLLA